MLRDGYVLGVQINSQDELALYYHFFDILDNDEYNSKVLITPNPEILVDSYKSKERRELLNQADISLADGFGVTLMARLLFHKKLYRLTGVDVVKNILDELNEREDSKIVIVDWIGGLSSKKEIYLGLNKKYPNIQIKIKQIERGQKMDKEFWQEISNYPSDLFICTLGHPYQEQFLLDNKNKLNSKLALAVGASIDFIIGKQWRAPWLLRKLGLEWLFRWLQKPIRRSRRMFRALIVFPFLCLQWWFRSKFIYRPNVITLLYNDKGQILIADKVHKLIEKRGFTSDWEIPQGGVDKNEKLEDAVYRELREELGILRDALEIKKIVKNVWQYKWGKKSLPENYCFYKGFKGQ